MVRPEARARAGAGLQAHGSRSINRSMDPLTASSCPSPRCPASPARRRSCGVVWMHGWVCWSGHDRAGHFRRGGEAGGQASHDTHLTHNAPGRRHLRERRNGHVVVRVGAHGAGAAPAPPPCGCWVGVWVEDDADCSRSTGRAMERGDDHTRTRPRSASHRSTRRRRDYIQSTTAHGLFDWLIDRSIHQAPKT